MKRLLLAAITSTVLACTVFADVASNTPISVTILPIDQVADDPGIVTLRMRITNVGRQPVGVYDRMPVNEGWWYHWTHLLISSDGGPFREVGQPIILKDLPYADPILLAPGKTHEFDIPLKFFPMDFTDIPNELRVCVIYEVDAPYVPKHKGVWIGKSVSNTVMIRLKRNSSQPAGGAYVAPAAGAPSAHP